MCVRQRVSSNPCTLKERRHAWSKMSQNTQHYRDIIREFIQIYKSEPCLWQIKNELYYNRAMRRAAMDKLASKYKEIEANADRAAVTKKINVLRTAFNKEKKKVEAAKQIGKLYEPTLWYYKDLSFVHNQNDPASPYSTKEDNDDVVQRVYIDFENDEDSRCNIQGADMSSSDDSQTNEVPVRTATSRPSPKKRRYGSIRNVSQSLNDPIEFREEISKEDRHDVYCKYVACRLRDLPQQQRILAENLINNVLFHAECRGLTLGHKVVDTDSTGQQDSSGPSSHQAMSTANHSSKPYPTSTGHIKQSDSN